MLLWIIVVFQLAGAAKFFRTFCLDFGAAGPDRARGPRWTVGLELERFCCHSLGLVIPGGVNDPFRAVVLEAAIIGAAILRTYLTKSCQACVETPPLVGCSCVFVYSP
ncbi:hypothetical protein XENOCAPTIV_028400 [Xenoophorus captivus]|uniref:Secreted protein n=1 Tax=Xenoophorus captivus TaxID=1517983 RepID=A0ABV0SBI6_9TELE